MSDLTNKKELPSDQGSHETAALYVPANRLAKVDVIDVFTPLANRVMPRDPALAPTALHSNDRTQPMGGSGSRAASASGTIATSVLQRLHGSNSDELFGAALRSKQDSLINAEIPRFSLVGKLGEGSQGIVYRVNDRDCHREVACKVLSYATTDPEEISRFIHEAQVTAQLEHPGIVPIHDLGELRDGTVYYTMKRVDGVSMQDLLTTRSGKPEHRFELLEMFLRICETMAFAHSRGVIHRDLKPRNIMAGPFGEVLVLDWGLAKVVNCIDVARPMASPALAGLQELGCHTFFHNVDDTTLTSRGFLWTYPGKELTRFSIAVLPEAAPWMSYTGMAGICTDFITNWTF